MTRIPNNRFPVGYSTVCFCSIILFQLYITHEWQPHGINKSIKMKRRQSVHVILSFSSIRSITEYLIPCIPQFDATFRSQWCVNVCICRWHIWQWTDITGLKESAYCELSTFRIDGRWLHLFRCRAERVLSRLSPCWRIGWVDPRWNVRCDSGWWNCWQRRLKSIKFLGRRWEGGMSRKPDWITMTSVDLLQHQFFQVLVEMIKAWSEQRIDFLVAFQVHQVGKCYLDNGNKFSIFVNIKFFYILLTHAFQMNAWFRSKVTPVKICWI